MKVGDRIRVFEITKGETSMPEIQGMHLAEIQNEWFGTTVPDLPLIWNGHDYWCVEVGLHARHVATMVITKIKVNENI